MPRRAWDRREDEPAAMFERFVRYRDLPGTERSLARVGSDYGVTTQAIEKLSVRYKWVARVKAWTDYQDHLRQQQALDALTEMNTRQIKLGRGMQAVATRKLLKLEDKELTALDVARLGVHGVKIERLAAGETTENFDAEVTTTNVVAPKEDRARETLQRLRRVFRNPAAFRAALELNRALEADAGGHGRKLRPEVDE